MHLLGAAALFTAASIWGGMYVISKYVLDYIPPFTLLVMRLVLAGLVLGGFMLWRKEHRVDRRHWPLIASLGLVGFTASLGLQFWGTKLSSAHNGGLITAASPAFIVLFAALILKESATPRKLAALGLATLGVLAVVGPEADGAAGPNVALGNWSLFGAGVTWALYTVLGKLATTSYTSLTVATYATLTGLLFSAPVAWLTEWRLAPLDWSAVPAVAWWGVLYVGLISTAVAFYLWVLGFALMDAGTASLFFFAQPVVAAALGALLLGETTHWYFFLGAALIFAGLVVASRQPSSS
jgi:drug/metabolite transporter (DMT)-like permease